MNDRDCSRRVGRGPIRKMEGKSTSREIKDCEENRKGARKVGENHQDGMISKNPKVENFTEGGLAPRPFLNLLHDVSSSRGTSEPSH